MLAMREAERRTVRGAEVAMVFQDALSALNPVLPVGFQVAEGARRHLGLDRRAARERAVELLDLVGIPDAGAGRGGLPAPVLWGDEAAGDDRDRAGRRPRVLVADEPTTALDVTIQAQLLDLLRRLQQERRGAAADHPRHGCGRADGRRITVMYAGRVVEQGTADDVLGRPDHPYTRAC